MTVVYMLEHGRELGDEVYESKTIGIYSTEAEAQAAIARKLKYPGFAEWPDGFEIYEYKLDQDAWSEGFVVGE